MAITKAEKQELITKYGRKTGDTGSPEVQIEIGRASCRERV